MLVAAYVIFVGPVLYTILKYADKRDYYWFAVPATTLAGIVMIYFAGRGFEVGDTKVYSMSVRNLDEQEYLTYLRCYDAKHREWSLPLSEQYASVGPLVGIYYDNSYKESYYHHIRQEGDRLMFGMVPNASFEEGFFVAEGAKQTEGGTIQSEVNYGEHGIYGTVTNETAWDFAYFALIYDDTLYIYKDLPSGESCELGETKKELDIQKNPALFIWKTFWENSMTRIKKKIWILLQRWGLRLRWCIQIKTAIKPQ